MCRDTITVSLLEVYNEEIRDLLVVGGSQEKLEVRHGDGGNFVPGLTTMGVKDLQVRFFLSILFSSVFFSYLLYGYSYTGDNDNDNGNSDDDNHDVDILDECISASLERHLSMSYFSTFM